MSIPAPRFRRLPCPLLFCAVAWFAAGFGGPGVVAAEPGVTVLLVDTDRAAGQIDERIYGQFLEHINHSVVDGLYAEQVRGQGFEGKDFEDYWQAFADNGDATLATEKFGRSERSVRLTAAGGMAGVRQGRLYLEAAEAYDGSVWIKPERGAPEVRVRIKDSNGGMLAELPLKTRAEGWQ